MFEELVVCNDEKVGEGTAMDSTDEGVDSSSLQLVSIMMVKHAKRALPIIAIVSILVAVISSRGIQINIRGARGLCR